MIITISGKPGSGKTTVAKILAKKLKYKHYSVGDFMRKLAKKRRISLLELSKIAEKTKNVDIELDNMQKNLAKGDNFVIDSRLGFYFLPRSVKIFLDVNLKPSARRIYHSYRKDEKENTNLTQTLKNIKSRINSEKKRYKSYYGIDCYNKRNYDIVIDTTNLTPQQVVDKIWKKVKNNAI